MHTPLHLHTRLFAKKYCLLIYYKKIHSTNNLLYRIAGLAGLRYKKGQKCNMQHQRRGRSRTRRCRRRCRCRRLRPHAGWRVEKRERDCSARVRASRAPPPPASRSRARQNSGARTQPAPGPGRAGPRVHRVSVTDTRAPRGASLCFRRTAPGPPTSRRVRVHATRARSDSETKSPVAVASQRSPPQLLRGARATGERKKRTRGEHDGGPTRDRCRRPRLLALAAGPMTQVGQ